MGAIFDGVPSRAPLFGTEASSSEGGTGVWRRSMQFGSAVFGASKKNVHAA
jgi:hypothetical protein